MIRAYILGLVGIVAAILVMVVAIEMHGAAIPIIMIVVIGITTLALAFKKKK